MQDRKSNFLQICTDDSINIVIPSYNIHTIYQIGFFLTRSQGGGGQSFRRSPPETALGSVRVFR